MTFDPIKDVDSFIDHFGLGSSNLPRALPKDVFLMRQTMLEEEMEEYMVSQLAAYDETTRHPQSRDNAEYAYRLGETLDGLIDLIYAAMVTARMHGFPVEEAWSRVHEANMLKQKVSSAAESKRGSTHDLRKPPDWVAPDHSSLVEINDLFCAHEDRA